MSTNQPSEDDGKNIVVSIILTESTASLLELDLPHLEDLTSETNQSSSLINIKNAPYTKEGTSQACQSINKMSSETFYLTSIQELQESDVSLEEENDDGSSIQQEVVENSEDASALEENQHVLKRVDAVIRPLIMVRSIAHDDRLKNENNNIYVSVLSSELTVTSSGWINVCRICHGGESMGNLISPCRCRGSIALTHRECLERWLKESMNSNCELCQHHFQIIREPKYSIPKSILLFLRHPGEHLRDLIVDFVAFLVYTPSAVSSTYMLMLVCETVAKNALHKQRSIPAHVLTFSAILGMAVIDFTYSSWLMACLQKHVEAWREWYNLNSTLRLMLPEKKLKQCRKKCVLQDEVD